MVGFFCGDDRRVSGEREVNPRVRHQVCLELGQVDVKGAVESKRRRHGRDDLTEETVQVGVGGSLNVQIASGG